MIKNSVQKIYIKRKAKEQQQRTSESFYCDFFILMHAYLVGDDKGTEGKHFLPNHQQKKAVEKNENKFTS
jgi:hypothetical protein